jgi:hypothetical protein
MTSTIVRKNHRAIYRTLAALPGWTHKDEVLSATYRIMGNTEQMYHDRRSDILITNTSRAVGISAY